MCNYIDCLTIRPQREWCYCSTSHARGTLRCKMYVQSSPGVRSGPCTHYSTLQLVFSSQLSEIGVPMNKLQLPELGYISSHAVLRSKILLLCNVLRCQLKVLMLNFAKFYLPRTRLVYQFRVLNVWYSTHSRY